MPPIRAATSANESALAPRMPRMSENCAATSKVPFSPRASRKARISSVRPATDASVGTTSWGGRRISGGTNAPSLSASLKRSRRPDCAVGTTTRTCASDFAPLASSFACAHSRSATSSTNFRILTHVHRTTLHPGAGPYFATYAILRPFMEMFISIASFILSSVYLWVMSFVTGSLRSFASLRKSNACTQSFA